VERYYNSGRHTHLAAALCARFPSPFAFYEALADYWAACGFDRAPPDRLGQHEALGGFMRSRGMPLADRERWLCRYDLALSEPPRRQPAWVEETLPAQRGGSFRAFYEDPDRIGKFLPGFVGWEPRQIARRTHLERFPFHPGTAAQTPVCLLFDYSRRDILGHALVQEIPDE